MDESDRDANAEQIEFWNGLAGDSWVASQVEMDELLDGLIEPLLDAAEPTRGLRCIDVGCGCGATTLALRRRMGGDGHVAGVDVSAPMLARARERARQAELDIDFECADASSHRFGPHGVDRMISRFGVMFFDRPVEAFTHLRDALSPGGKLSFFCWQSAANNPWLHVPMRAIGPILAPDAPAPDPSAPGPFSLGDPQRLHGILQEAGFARHTIDDFPYPMGPRGSLDDALRFYTRRGPVARLFHDADAGLRDEATEALAAAIKPHHDGERVNLQGNAFLVTAAR